VNSGLHGKLYFQTMYGVSKEEKRGYGREDKAFVDMIERGTAALVPALGGNKSVE
jgi:hypothetical protein